VSKIYYWLLLFGVLVWVATLAIILPSPSPIEAMGGDAVAPQITRAGSSVTVVRNFRIMRDIPIRVTRAMVKGDCNKSCEIVDLSTSHLVLAPGVYHNVRREHQIPATVTPGTWTLIFTVHWGNFLGADHKMNLPPLDIEVVK